MTFEGNICFPAANSKPHIQFFYVYALQNYQRDKDFSIRDLFQVRVIFLLTQYTIVKFCQILTPKAS